MGAMQIHCADVVHGLSVISCVEATHVWAQGCPHSCSGCCNQEYRAATGGTLLDVRDLADAIAARPRTRLLVLSGGEPFGQARAAASLCAALAEARPHLGVVAYTGYALEDLVHVPHARELLEYVDVLVDGPYMADMPADDGVRGSTNQRVIQVGARVRASTLGRPPELRFEFRTVRGHLRFIGLPPPDWRSLDDPGVGASGVEMSRETGRDAVHDEGGSRDEGRRS